MTSSQFIARNPLPHGWLPKSGPKKRFPVLYPGEDRTLLACTKIPLAYRMLYGFLHREGMRRSEAAELQWSDVDLENGMVRLDDNKTDYVRDWPLAEGVAEALEAWAEVRGGVDPEDRVFIDEYGRPLSVDHLTDRVRAHLKLAGLNRATRSLATGRNEDFVRRRTGHKSDELLTYRQTANALAELDQGELDPLSLAVPECPGNAPGETTRRWRNGRRASLRC